MRFINPEAHGQKVILPFTPPIILLAFANDQGDGSRYLRKLRDELRRIDTLLRPVDLANRCRVRLQPYANLEGLLDLLQTYRDQVAILHYGGHSDSFGLFLETAGRQVI
jgi:hypothetical protein